ncbi:TPA: aminodeoxychorismate/anthranilate synthase component II [Pseudomonas aeruginosa]|uniref:anthranilate synthase n=1 Tax=Pseudomonas aeruginosa TaxID=287 RepID=A0A6A9JVB2_PSEAI|nr:anthranilate synthase component II [Pseudomonas aeruginosa]MBG7459371.1 aminodeoxychorismate/anthranilate synthase component II [Pseudomonas aeruginosa]MBL4545873.1 aminodeoxychorismate/anthranilate synthase component II [Pseudomonas aeruginosa]MBO2831713.1 aminodeoxychorismate/anthranilate synthase component II [Pseudomonas aeruginosa]MBV5795557.1 aminodeoxychorismate/anthranilate synthase component II [Pseudomonas aeruginosa]MCT2411006.1 anthranilate synthase component II [Pseudomonas aer
MRITLLDNFDSFTYNLVEQFCLLGAEVRVMRNDTPLPTIQAALLADGCELLVLSPGPGRPEDAGCMLELLAWARGRLPVLGVCLGHQALALAAGGSVGEARKPLHGKSTSLRFDQRHPLFDGIADLRVARYHSLVVSRLPEGFDCLADADGEIMAMADPRNRQLGLQFHPESILTTHGQRLLENALLWCGALAVRERLRA